MASSTLGCSSQPEGVDDDSIGVALNYICSLALLCVSFSLYRSHASHPSATTIVTTELGMSLGYLLGGIVHGTFPNRASDDNCAAYYFYPLFSFSYFAMIVSSLAWLQLAKPNAPLRDFSTFVLLVSATLILTGAVSCQFTVSLYPGATDDCPPSEQAVCDRIMMTGEGLFYLTWVVGWAVVAYSLNSACPSFQTRLCNVLAPVSLFFGPGQILLVCLLPVLTAPSVAQGMANSMALYCTLRTGVTYILAVLACHLFSSQVAHKAILEKPTIEYMELPVQQEL